MPEKDRIFQVNSLPCKNHNTDFTLLTTGRILYS